MEATVRKLTAIWRVFGSPRISGDKKVYSWIKQGWKRKERAIYLASVVTSNTRNRLITASGVVAALLLVWLAMSLGNDDISEFAVNDFPTPTPFAGPQYMTEVQALNLAIMAARDNGLISQNFSHIARRIQFGEYAQAIGELDRANRGLLETPADTEVWAFAFAGDVQLELATGDRVNYDNLSVVIDALTGNVYRVEAFYGDYESEARAPAWLRPPTPTAISRVDQLTKP